jgi:FkbM family methyltransferase
LNRLARKILPLSLINFIGACRFRGTVNHITSILRQRSIARSYRASCPPLAENELFIPPDITLRISPKARESFERYCFQDPEVVDELQSFISFSRERKLLLDIGAEYGLFAIVFTARPGSFAHAFEPSSVCLQVLREHVQSNRPEQIKVHEGAVGESDGVLEMVEDGVMLRAATPADDTTSIRRLTVRSIDSLVEKDGLRADAIKIDVEGFEMAVIRGGRAYLKQSRPILFLEVHPPFLDRSGATVASLFEELKSLGYRFHSTRGKALADPVAHVGRHITRVICD